MRTTPSLPVCSNFVISDIELWDLGGIGIEMFVATTGITNFTIKNCIVANAGDEGIVCGDCSNFVVDSCTAQNCGSIEGGPGFDFLSAFYYVIRNCIAQNCVGGFYRLSSSFGYLENCVTESCSSGFFVQGANEIKFNGCVAKDGIGSGSGAGFDLTGAIDGEVMNCSASNNGIDGFGLPGAIGCMAMNCSALNNVADGFDLEQTFATVT